MGARLILGLVLLIATYMALIPMPELLQQSVNDKLGHLLLFVILGFLTHASWGNRRFNRKHALPLFAYGVTLECLQYFSPTRYFSWLDMLANGSGILLYWLIAFFFLSALSSPPSPQNSKA
jgi:glycopeptide antibiotics resistance protein